MKQTLALSAVTLALLGACSPVVRVRARVERVDGVPVDPNQVVVRVRASCRKQLVEDAGPPTPPDAGPKEVAPRYDPDAGATPMPAIETVYDVLIEDGQIAFSLHGFRCEVAMTAWLDVSRDGVVGPGDYVGTIGPVEVVDRGLCAGNINDVGPFRIARIEP